MSRPPNKDCHRRCEGADLDMLVLAAGEALPSELMHYQPELLKAVRDYEAIR